MMGMRAGFHRGYSLQTACVSSVKLSKQSAEGNKLLCTAFIDYEGASNTAKVLETMDIIRKQGVD